jgi:hypothetical protein
MKCFPEHQYAGFDKTLAGYWIRAQLSACREGLYFMELVKADEEMCRLAVLMSSSYVDEYLSNYCVSNPELLTSFDSLIKEISIILCSIVC